MTRGIMTMRAEVERSAPANDAWNRPGPPNFISQGTIACRVFEKNISLKSDNGKLTTVNELKILMPLTATVQGGDRLVNVKNRRGTVLFSGPLYVDQPVRKTRHLESRLLGHGTI